MIASIARSWFLLVLLFVSQLAAQEKLADETLGFTLVIPEGFQVNNEVAQANPKIAHAYLYEHPDDEEKNVLLIIEKMRGTIGQERLDASHLPPGSNAKLFVTQWQGYDVDGVELFEEQGMLQLITYNVQIPLKKLAIQLKLCAAPSNKAELDRVMRAVLDNLQGETSWQTTAAAIPAPQRDPNNNYGKLLLTIAIISIIAGLLLLFWISKRTPPGTILVIAVVIWVLGSAMSDSTSREGQMTSGTLKMLGFIGGILGIVDLVKGRKPPQLPMADFAP